MTVQDLCEHLAKRYGLQLLAVTGGVSVPPDDVLSSALSTEWLRDNAAEIFTVLQKGDGRESELVGALEINAFLAAFQRAYEDYRLPRSRRWANRFTWRNRLISTNGALKKQLNAIGVKVDNEFLRDVVHGSTT